MRSVSRNRGEVRQNQQDLHALFLDSNRLKMVKQGSGRPRITCKCKVSRCGTCSKCSRCGCNHDGVEVSVKVARTRGGIQAPSNQPVENMNRRKRRRVSAQEQPLSTEETSVNQTLHQESSLRQLREAFGIAPDDMPCIPHLANRTNAELDWDEIPLRRGLVRFVMKLLVTIARITCPGNHERLLQDVCVAIQCSQGHAGESQDLNGLISSVRECNQLLPRDSLQRQAMVAPFCLSLSNAQCKNVCSMNLFHCLYSQFDCCSCLVFHGLELKTLGDICER